MCISSTRCSWLQRSVLERFEREPLQSNFGLGHLQFPCGRFIFMLDKTHAHTDSLVTVCKHLHTDTSRRTLPCTMWILWPCCMVLFLPGAVWKWPGRGLLEHWTGHGLWGLVISEFVELIEPLGTIGDHWGPLGTYETSAWVDHPDTSRLLSLASEMIEYLSTQRYSP